MKKFAKMSLVAAVAVAGMTSANAVSLEEAIKGVDVSGQFRYRVQDQSTETTGTGTSGTDVEIEATAKVPVNDMVTAVFKIDTTRDTTDGTAAAADYLDVEDYYFQYVNGAITLLAGQQNIPGRMTDGDQGNGLVALYNAGAFTVGAASFMDQGVDSAGVGNDKNVNSVIAMGSVGPVSLLAQYADVQDVLEAFNVKADANIEGIKVGLEYTESELDTGATKDDRSTFKAYVSGSIDMVTATLAYAETGKNGSGSIDNQTVRNVETPSELLLWNVGTAQLADAEVIALDVSAAITDKVTLRAAILDGEVGTAAGKDVEEVLGQITYKMSSNLTTYVRYSQYDSSATSDTDEGERARLEVKYSF